MTKKVLFIMAIFLFGWVAGAYSDNSNHAPIITGVRNVADTSKAYLGVLLGKNSPERASPKDRVFEKDIHVLKDKVVIDIKDAQWSRFTDTNSMDPVLDKGANAIQIAPKNISDISVGDIISYESEYGTIIHRVVEIGNDSKGWYCYAKGDNNPARDMGKIRFDKIKRVVVAIIF